MATLKLDGLDAFEAALARIGTVPPEVKTQALTKMADVAKAAIKRSGEAMGVRDPESDVHILDKITTAKPKLSDSGGSLDITFSGSRRRGNTTTTNSAIAFFNEFGRRGQAARPFMGKAMSENDAQITAAGGEILGAWIENEF